MKIFFLPTASLIFLTICISCGPKRSQQISEKKTADLTSTGLPKDRTPEEIAERLKQFESESSIPAAPIQNWNYSEDEDRMTSKTTNYAQTESTVPIQFEFPYHGGSTFSLILRKKAGAKSELLLKCDKCQFIHSYGESNILKVKFDENEPESYSFNTPADGSSDVIFIEGTSRFITKLKKANHVLIGAQFYQAGTQYIDFDVEGLKWN